MRNIRTELHEGDWVTGKTANDEKFRGYVEQVDAYGGMVQVKVLESDHDVIIGHTVKAALVSVEPIPAETSRSEADLMNMIDIALQTRDRAWFEELTAELLALRGDAGSRSLRPDRGNVVPKSRVS
jgi:predicted RNA-binding protein Jag